MRPKSILMLTCSAPLALAAPATAQEDCASLAGPAFDDTIVSESRLVEASDGLPEHCLVQGVIEPRIGAGGRQYGTGFELRLPTDWSGRFVFQGGGGWDGSVRPAIGTVDRSRPQDTALGRGIAVASTDAGHTGDSATDGWFGIDMKARSDNGYRSVELVTDRAKALMARFYGEEPHHSYFMGCSNGGRQGMVAAVRYPEKFDGVVAGAPAFDLTPAVIAWNWNTRALIEAAPEGPDGRLDLARALTDEDLALVSDAAIEACDGLDGVEDGLVSRPMECRFDPATLQCGEGEEDGCLNAAQVTALEKIQEGPRDGAGELIYHGWPLAGIDGPDGWRAWIVGTTGWPSDARGWTFSEGWMRLVGATPPRPDFDATTFDIDDRGFLMENAPVFAATSTDYEAFRGNGGKMIVWHGTADPAFSTGHLVAWFESMAEDNGGAEATSDFARLFLVPGMHHCAGGASIQSFDALTPIIDWVENGMAPEEIVATGAPDGPMADVSRPLCPYPQYPRRDGEGERSSSEAFACTMP